MYTHDFDNNIHIILVFGFYGNVIFVRVRDYM
jgi:hypothetical protein